MKSPWKPWGLHLRLTWIPTTTLVHRPTWQTELPCLDAPEIPPGPCSLHNHAKSLRGARNHPQQRKPQMYTQPTWRFLISQGQPMVLLTVRQNRGPNCYLDPKIQM